MDEREMTCGRRSEECDANDAPAAGNCSCEGAARLGEKPVGAAIGVGDRERTAECADERREAPSFVAKS